MNRDSRLDQMQDLNVPYNGFQPKPKSSKYRSFNDSYGQAQPSFQNLPPQLRNVQPAARSIPNTNKHVHRNMITSPYQGEQQQFYSEDPDVTPIDSLEEFQPEREEEKQHIKETFSPSGDDVNCKDLLEHVKKLSLM